MQPFRARYSIGALAAVALFALPAAAQSMHGGHGGAHHALWGDSDYRSPGLAVLLSLTPVPVDFGNLYVENIAWGVVYTGVELGLMLPAMWLAGGHMGYGHWGRDTQAWTVRERNSMIGLTAGYVVVKLVSGLQAGYAARDFNDEAKTAAAPAVSLVPGGAVLGLVRRF